MPAVLSGWSALQGGKGTNRAGPAAVGVFGEGGKGQGIGGVNAAGVSGVGTFNCRVTVDAGHLHESDRPQQHKQQQPSNENVRFGS